MSEAARRRFSRIKPAVSFDGEVMRLDTVEAAASGGELKLAVYVGEPEEGDRPIEHDGEPLLYVDRMVCAAYDGCVVDLEETSEGLCLVIGSPRSERLVS